MRFLLIRLVDGAFRIYNWLIIARIVASWVQPPTHHQFMRDLLNFVYRTTEPVLGPIRELVPLPGIDISPIIAFVVLGIIRNGLIQLLFAVL
ncbi:YggT family protein [Natroniella acetigena]|uniref:YggT family protein n=1 Tax=Natroniella acetigena TaxID=52004 RepID=UPI00200B9898|nr:YggT family protein [Natroniella acetigena]MCK8827618.1 YggT family protein [Natroniella acetigena]